MGTTRFKGETASERLNFESISDSDMIQVRHLPGTLNDADKGISKAQLASCPFGVCDTAANTALKTISLADSNPDFVLVSGREVVIYFANANTETSPVINFEGSGSYPLFFDNGSPVGTWAAGTWMHLKFFSVEINDTLIQRWILLSPLTVDAVTANNMQSVTSNAVANELALRLKTYEQPWGPTHSYPLVPNSTYILFCQNPNVLATDIWLIKSRHSNNASLTGYCQIIMKGTYSPDYNIGITGDTLTIERECVTSLIKINVVYE